MSEQIAIRPAVTDDISTLLEFEQRLIDYERPHTTSLQSGPISYYDLSQLIEAEDSQVLVAHIGPRLIGCGYAQIRESKWYYKHIKHSYLGFMFVDSDYRGRGINKRIMDGLKQWSYAKDIKEMRLSVFDSNQSAVRAYQKVGFAPDLLEMVLELMTRRNSEHYALGSLLTSMVTCLICFAPSTKLWRRISAFN